MLIRSTAKWFVSAYTKLRKIKMARIPYTAAIHTYSHMARRANPLHPLHCCYTSSHMARRANPLHPLHCCYTSSHMARRANPLHPSHCCYHTPTWHVEPTPCIPHTAAIHTPTWHVEPTPWPQCSLRRPDNSGPEQTSKVFPDTNRRLVPSFRPARLLIRPKLTALMISLMDESLSSKSVGMEWENRKRRLLQIKIYRGLKKREW